MRVPKQLLEIAGQRCRLINLPQHDSIIHLAMALPVGGDGGGDIRAAGFLPPAARMESGRTPSGRGLSKEQAETRALGEAAQLISSCVWGNEDVVTSKFTDLDGQALHPNALMMIGEEQYQNRDSWNAENGDHDWIPLPFDIDKEADWVQVEELNGQSAIWVPAACVYIGWQNRGEANAFSVADSNGTAAGETLESATVAAFLELVERDATAIWWHGQHRRPMLEMAGLDLPDPFRDWLAKRGRLYQVLDLTHDLDIPVFAAVSSDDSGGSIAIGISANFDPAAALVDALTEMCQMEFTVTMAKQQPDVAAGTPIGRWLETVTLSNMACLQPSSQSNRYDTSKSDEKNLSDKQGIERITAICTDHDLKAYRVDLTRPQVGVPVARVIVPGLCHFKKRDAADRLVDVPQKLGWDLKLNGTATLNPIPLLI